LVHELPDHRRSVHTRGREAARLGDKPESGGAEFQHSAGGLAPDAMTISWREQSSFGSETARKGRSRRREEAEPDLQSRIRLLTSAATNRGSAAPWLSPSGREFPKTNISRSESLNRGSAFS